MGIARRLFYFSVNIDRASASARMLFAARQFISVASMVEKPSADGRRTREARRNYRGRGELILLSSLLRASQWQQKGMNACAMPVFIVTKRTV